MSWSSQSSELNTKSELGVGEEIYLFVHQPALFLFLLKEDAY